MKKDLTIDFTKDEEEILLDELVERMKNLVHMFGRNRKERMMGDIKDTYEGDWVQIWEDEGFVYIAFTATGCTVCFPKDLWPAIKAEIAESDKEGQ